jgi:hypothetical protein
MKLPGVTDYARVSDQVAGWFTPTDFLVFDTLLAHQLGDGITGDLLEIGCYRGKSAIVLGYAVRPQERVVVCDMFERVGEHPDVRQLPIEADPAGDYLCDFSMAQFVQQWAAYHHRLPELRACDSADLTLAHPLRFAHIDGCHNYRCVARDIALVVASMGPRGVVVVDDYRDFGVPGVAAAAWEARHAGLIHPFCITAAKMYAAVSAGDQRYWAAVMKAQLGDDGFRGDIYDFPDFDLVRIVS